MKIKRVMLISPPDSRPPDMPISKVRIGLVAPIGLAYIAAVLEQNSYEVKILDAVAEAYNVETPYNRPPAHLGELRYGLTDLQIYKQIEDYKPDLVGVSCLFSNKAFDAHNVCRLAKLVNPEIITVMGGSHPTALPEETLRDKNVDHVVKGEGEYGLWTLIESLNECGEYNPSVWEPLITDLSDLFFPARHLLNMPVYLNSESAHSRHKFSPSTNISTSRGCPGRCSFCAIRGTFGEAYRTRSPDNVLREVELLVDRYHIKELNCEDDNISADRKRFVEILERLKPFKLALNSPSGLYVNSLDEALLDKMVEAGYYSISLAIESGVPEVLKLMHKRVDLAKAKRLTDYGRSIGLRVKAFFILGYPGETKDTMQRTVDYASNLGADWSLFFPATNLPGTELDRLCRKNGWLVDPNLDYRRYFFTPNIRTPEFDPDYVVELKERANKEINFVNNVNLREHRYRRAIEDFQEVLSLYPDLIMAQRGLREAQNGRE